MVSRSSSSKRTARWLRILTLVFAGAIFAMLVDVFVDSALRHTQNLAAAVIGVFGALVLALLALASPGALEELSFGPFKARWRLSELESRVQSLRLAVLSLLTVHERRHLRKLEPENKDAKVQYLPEMYRELERLTYLGYLAEKPEFDGLEGMRKQYENDRDAFFPLSDYLSLTDMGRKYLELYREWTLPIEVSAEGVVRIDGTVYDKAESWEEIVDFAREAGWLSEPDPEEVKWARRAPAALRTSTAPRSTGPSVATGVTGPSGGAVEQGV
ncbi:hypothetical protein [Kitasatospora sp. NPDC097643]|uniref:hypothetical protein n=1 Tax=Kitasatospora sp. NPDC097643 TaxID=3157230 RepID=UPI003331ED05